MSLLDTMTHATLAATITLATFVGLPLAFTTNQSRTSEAAGVEEAGEAMAEIITLTQADLVALGLAEGAPAPGEADQPARQRAPMLTETVGAWHIPNGTRAPQRARGTLSSKPSSSRSQCTPEPLDGIRELGQQRWEVERSLVRTYSRDIGRLYSLGAAHRHTGADGAPDGYRLTKVGCASPLHAAGLKRGDVLHSVNGQPVTTSAEVVKAYAKHRKARRLEVEITRRGRPMTLHYEVV